MKYIVLIQVFMLCFSHTALCRELVEEEKQYAKRVVSLGPIHTENIYLLGAGERLVGNTIYCVRPEEARKKPKVGTVMEASVEKIIGLQPDLILASGLTPPPLVQKLRASGVKVVKDEQPKSLKESCDNLLELGKLLGLEEEAEKIIKGVWRDVETITRAVSGYPSPKVLFQIGSQPLFAAVPGSFTEDFIRLSNGINIIGEQKNGVFNREKIISRNPDIIFIAIMGSEAGIAGQEKRSWQRFTTINAVKNKRVYIIDPDISCSPSPTTFIRTLRIIAGLIHPEADLQGAY